MARPDPYSTVYLDSCVLTRFFARGDGWERVQRIMDAADAGQFEIYVSTFSLVECLAQSPTPHPDVGLDARVLQYVDGPRVVLVEFGREVALQARDLHLIKQYKLGDAIHIASALEASVDVLFTFDEDDFPIGTKVGAVWVDLPYLPGEPTLFDHD
ncbi:type II toxin-antitoxin system VapC family toxin [Amycolatopsis sp. RTGN1]|uniref:type II toxin-antitoxin system VapC family toxin n=1 Tax=Amycolatopsis ponsaeliensis TaxID=2992142 RepID=UPI002550C28B|nr:PIN domain-containing protein [Amycolatopsis sp. RTGN1]